MAVSTRTRFEILKRDGFRCRYCGADPTKGVLHVDHVLAIANGGSDDPVNLVASCRSCNLGKSDVPLEARKFAPPSSPEELLEQAEQIRSYLGAQKELASAKSDVIEAMLDQWDAEVSKVWPRDLRSKLRNALADLDVADVMEAISITGSRVAGTAATRQSKYLSGVLRSMRLKRRCSPALYALIERARLSGFGSLRAKRIADKRHLTWMGPDKMPDDLSRDLFSHFDELESVS